MLVAVVTQSGSSISVHLPASGPFVTAEEVEVPEKDLNPIFPELKEVVWGFGPFVVLALLMRFALFPKLKKGMDARYSGIRADHEGADAARAAAKAEVADYEAQLAGVKAQAAARIDAVRQTLEAERQAKLAEVNARIAEQKAVAQAEADALRAAAQDQIHAAVSSVAGHAGQLATGRAPSADVLNRVINEVMAK